LSVFCPRFHPVRGETAWLKPGGALWSGSSRTLRPWSACRRRAFALRRPRKADTSYDVLLQVLVDQLGHLEHVDRALAAEDGL
jgi:hypothetical protein